MALRDRPQQTVILDKLGVAMAVQRPLLDTHKMAVVLGVLLIQAMHLSELVAHQLELMVVPAAALVTMVLEDQADH